VSLLADLAVDWDEAVGRGPDSFARDVAAADRSRGRGGRPNVNGNGSANGNGHGNGYGRSAGGPPPVDSERARVAVGPGPDPGSSVGVPVVADRVAVAAVSPLRAGARAVEASPARMPDLVPAAELREDDDEPAFPDEVSAQVARAASAPTLPVEAGADQVLHVRFTGGSGTEGAMEAFQQLLRAHPGATRVVIHVPSGRSGGELPMELRSGVAYDAELVAEVQRRLGPGAASLSLE